MGCNVATFNNEGMVSIVDYDIHPGEAYYLVELVAALIDSAIARHKSSHFRPELLYSLRQIFPEACKRACGKIRFYLLGDI